MCAYLGHCSIIVNVQSHKFILVLVGYHNFSNSSHSYSFPPCWIAATNRGWLLFIFERYIDNTNGFKFFQLSGILELIKCIVTHIM